MCIGIGNIILILGYATLDTPVIVVTSRELWNQNQAVSETKTWQLYGALKFFPIMWPVTTNQIFYRSCA